MRRSLLFCCLLLLAGCVSPLQKLKAINPSGNDFQSLLASEYLSYAESESEQGRKLGAEWYAEKGLKALQGKPEPPNPVDPSLPAQDRQELSAARSQLMALMTPEMKEDAPGELARAQLLYDCWQHEIRKRLNEQLAPCQEEFQSALGDLQGMADSVVYNQETEYTFKFAKGSTHLTAEGRSLAREIAKETAGSSAYTVEIAALDTIGRRERLLAAGRMSNVYNELVKIGVARKNIRVKKEASAKKVYLSCDVSPGNKGTVTVTLRAQ